MEYIIFVVAILFFLAVLMIKGYFDHKKYEKRFIKKLYEEYGNLPDKEYSPERFKNISHYFFRHKQGFFVDDITWNDLNMDEVFQRMNYTYSAAGEEYLYYTLRTPVADSGELCRREGLIGYFRKHADDRVAIQMIFSKLGYMGKFSIYDYLDYLEHLGQRNNFHHYASFVLVLVAVVIMFLNVPMGLLVLVGVFIYNNITYFKEKNEIDPYITSFHYIFRLLHAVDAIRGRNLEIIKEENGLLKKYSSAMTGFKTGSFLLMSGNRMSGSGNPLDIFVDYLRITFHLDLIKFNQMLSEVRKNTWQIDQMLTIIGYLETMIAIGAYRESLDTYCIPDFEDKIMIQAEGIYHPLLPDPVKNGIFTEQSVLVTGSNASGKSTFLKTVAINGILAQTIHTVLAERYQTAMFRICSSMSLRDDVQGGDSYYMVEIKSLKRILEEIKKEGLPVLCFVDEVLRGTNTVERIAASTQILRSMSASNCLCFAATHDIELTHLLEDCYKNYHFSEEIAENDIFFSYKIRNGRATTRNAIKLLGIMGYDPQIIQKAEETAGGFLRTGKWQALD